MEEHSAQVQVPSCSKPRCGADAVATFRFDYQASAVQLEVMPADIRDAGYLLCMRHVDGFVAPVGWTLSDLRVGSPGNLAEESCDMSPLQAALDAEHPSVRSRADRGLEVRPAGERAVPVEDHPSGPLELERRDEDPAITREINRLARHLAYDADTDPGAGMPPGLHADEFDEADGDIDDEIDVFAVAPAHDTLGEAEPASFGEELPFEEMTEQITIADLERAATAAELDGEESMTGHR